ncbi:MAG: ABC transporter permease [Firmicutes bacterium]|nr:ABC transporter permease [Bacillota bacterium]
MKKQNKGTSGYRHLFVAPFIIFMLVMVVFPLSLLFYHAFTYEGSFTFDHFRAILTDGPSLAILWRSLWVAVLAAVIIMLIAYPIAYGLAMTGFKRGRTILLLFTLPMWTNLLLRSIALNNLFSLIGLENGFLALMIALVMNFLPIMILPLYVVLSNIDKKYIEASQDLGATPGRVFTKTVLPLSVPGIIAGFVLVFTPIVSTFFLSARFGGNSWRMFGQLLSDHYTTRHFGLGSVLSIILLIVVALTVLVLNRFSKVGNKRGGLW